MMGGEYLPFRGRYFRRAPKLRLEFGLQTKFESTSERKYLYHKHTGRMEANGDQTDASFEYTPSKCVGIVEFRDGDLTLLWTNIGFKQFGIFVGDE
jgi:hypothetical protein